MSADAPHVKFCLYPPSHKSWWIVVGVACLLLMYVRLPNSCPAACSNTRPTPELCLLGAVVQTALRVLLKRRHRAEVQVVTESEALELFCEWLGWEADVTREAAAVMSSVYRGHSQSYLLGRLARDSPVILNA